MSLEQPFSYANDLESRSRKVRLHVSEKLCNATQKTLLELILDDDFYHFILRFTCS